MPKVSIIVAAYNCQHVIGDCLASVERQAWDDWEVIVGDDASTDGTRDVVREWMARDPRIRLVCNPTNLKAAETRNRCLEAALGEYVAIQDADDLMLPDRLAVQLRFLETHPDLDFVSTGMSLFDEEGQYAERVPAKAFPVARDFLWGLPFCHAATMFRAAALQRIHGYRVAPETVRGQDYDLFMRLYAAGGRGCNLPEILYGYREGRHAYQRRTWKHRQNEMIIRYKGFKAMGLFPWGVPFVLKPLLVGLVPSQLIFKLKTFWHRLRKGPAAAPARPAGK